MSKQNQKDTGFSSALFIDPFKLNDDIIDIQKIEEFENMNLGVNSFIPNNATPKSSDTKLNEINFLSKDLLKRMNENSPTNPKTALSSLRRTSEICEENEEYSKSNYSHFYQMNKNISYENNNKNQFHDYYNLSPLKDENIRNLSDTNINPGLFTQFNNSVCFDHPKRFNTIDDVSFYPKNFNVNNFKNSNGVFNPTNTITRNIPAFFPQSFSNNQDSKSFMYGKPGWVCCMCKNFNYESIYI
jgi:hypothetical protein